MGNFKNLYIIDYLSLFILIFIHLKTIGTYDELIETVKYFYPFFLLNIFKFNIIFLKIQI